MIKSVDPDRRRILLASAGAVITLMAGGAGLISVSQTDWALRRWLSSFLHYKLPGVRIPDTEIDKFTSELKVGGRNRLFAAVDTYVPAGAILARFSIGGTGFERAILTSFLMQSDYFSDKFSPTTVKYTGVSPACPNPWADLT